MTIKDRMLELKGEADKLSRQETHTPRDVALGVEIYSKYLDLLDEIQDGCANGVSAEVTVRVGGVDIKFDNIDKVAEWAASNG